MAPGTLEDNLGYQLQRAARNTLAAGRCALDDLGLTPARVTALMHIADNPGCDQTELGRVLLVNRSAGMKVAGLLSGLGLVERKDGRDRRSKGLFLTAAGARALRDATQRLDQSSATSFGVLDTAEHARLLAILKTLNAVPTGDAAMKPTIHAKGDAYV